MMRGFQIGRSSRSNSMKKRSGRRVRHLRHYYSKAKEYSVLELVIPRSGSPHSAFPSGKGENLIPEGGFVRSPTARRASISSIRGLSSCAQGRPITRLIAGSIPSSRTRTRRSSHQPDLDEIKRSRGAELGFRRAGFVSELSSAASVSTTWWPRFPRRPTSFFASVNAIADNLETSARRLKNRRPCARLLDARVLEDAARRQECALRQINASFSELQKAIKNIQDITARSPRDASLSLTIEEGRTAIKQGRTFCRPQEQSLLKGGIPERQERQPLSQSLREGGF
jgi:hypothetical protein